MAKIRIGLGSDFALNNGRLGLGVSDPQVRLEVDGTTKSNDLVVTGVTSLTAYEGFLRADHQIDQDTILNVGQGLNASLSGEIIVKDGTTVTVGAVGLGTTEVGIGTDNSVGVGTTTNQKGTTTIDSNAVNLAGGSEIECLKVFNTFTPPSGGTNERPYAPKPGELYYNYDFKTIEFFDGNGWRQVDNTTRSGRGFVMGGFTPIGPAVYNNIDFYNIMTRGNSQDFRVLTESRQKSDSCARETRAINTGTGAYNNTIDYITMASQSDGIDFGDLSTANRAYLGALASSTRGVFGGGFQHPSPSSSVDVIDYIEIGTLGNALDFGNLSAAKNSVGAVSSPTRGVFSGGSSPGITEYITIASKGNATTDALPYDSGTTTGASNSVKAIFETDKGIFSLNISSLGNQEYFGDLTSTREDASCASSPTRICFAGGLTPAPAAVNTIDYVTIASSGDAIDFGDISYAGVDGMTYGGGCSDSHGGLGGF